MVPMSSSLLEAPRIADVLSKHHTIKAGCRSFDILHAATALQLGAKDLLSFDDKQRQLAAAEGLKAKP
jgi:predicted nucleic acid-binding protein